MTFGRRREPCPRPVHEMKTSNAEEMMPLRQQVKQALIEDLNLQSITPEDIEDDAPLFGDGLGLDSLDAVELVVLVQKRFGVEIKNMDEGRVAFASVTALAWFIEEHR